MTRIDKPGIVIGIVLVLAILVVPVTAVMGPAMNDRDIRGNNINDGWNTHVSSAAECAQLCNARSDCVAVTYVIPGIQGPEGHCWMKSVVVPDIQDNNCISFIKQADTDLTMIKYPDRSIVVYDVTPRPDVVSSSQSCVIQATPDKTSLAWGNDVTVTGSATNCQYPIAVYVSGPGLPAPYGERLENCTDIAVYGTSGCPVGPYTISSSGPFSFTWKTTHIGLNSNVQLPNYYNYYYLEFVEDNGQGKLHNPVSLDFSKGKVCFITASLDKVDYTWGQNVSIRGIASNCPGGIKFKLGSAAGGPAVPGLPLVSFGPGVPASLEIGSAQSGIGNGYDWTWDTSTAKQKYGLTDGKYTIYITDLAEDQYNKVIPNIVSGTGVQPFSCKHTIRTYVAPRNGSIKTPIPNVPLGVYGTDYDKKYSGNMVVANGTTDSAGVAIVDLPPDLVAKYMYFYPALANTPPNYGIEGWVFTPGDNTPQQMDTKPFTKSGICDGVTEYWLVDLTGPKKVPLSSPGYTKTGTFTNVPDNYILVWVDNRTMEKGKDVTVPVYLCNVKDVGSMGLKVNYDGKILKFVSADKGTFTQESLFDSNDQVKPGSGSYRQVKIGFVENLGGKSGSGSIAQLTFNVIGNTGDVSEVSPGDIELKSSSGQDIGVMGTDIGWVTVGALQGGDYDGDKKFTVKDALAALQMYVGKIPVDLNLDVNKDGKVDPSDVREILVRSVQGP